MEYRRLGKTGLHVSQLCLGTMTFGWTADERNAYEVLNASLEAGINFIDTADIYSRWHPGNPGGVAETLIGNWLRGKPRERIIIATKARGRMGLGPNDEGLSRAHVLQSAEASLRRLRTDYIDLYQLHYPDEETSMEETLRALDDLIHQGKVRYIGVSNYSAWQVVNAVSLSDRYNLTKLVCVQPHYNLVWRAEFEREMLGACMSEGLGVIPYSPLQGGFLTGKYRMGQPSPRGARGEGNDRMTRFLTEHNMRLLDTMANMGRRHDKTISQVALAWLLTRPIVSSPIIGANNTEQLKEALGAIDFQLSPAQVQELDQLTAWQ
ncbi:MAG: aldo/keto reductase [Chloroflexi bacterium]|nr:aldo/keto reductase [Chloroflexota bacterium]